MRERELGEGSTTALMAFFGSYSLESPGTGRTAMGESNPGGSTGHLRFQEVTNCLSQAEALLRRAAQIKSKHNFFYQGLRQM